MIKTIDPIPISSVPFSEMLLVPMCPNIQMRLSITKKISDETQISPNQYIPKVPKRPQFTFSIKKAAIVVNEQRRKKR